MGRQAGTHNAHGSHRPGDTGAAGCCAVTAVNLLRLPAERPSVQTPLPRAFIPVSLGATAVCRTDGGIRRDVSVPQSIWPPNWSR